MRYIVNSNGSFLCSSYVSLPHHHNFDKLFVIKDLFYFDQRKIAFLLLFQINHGNRTIIITWKNPTISHLLHSFPFSCMQNQTISLIYDSYFFNFIFISPSNPFVQMICTNYFIQSVISIQYMNTK